MTIDLSRFEGDAAHLDGAAEEGELLTLVRDGQEVARYRRVEPVSMPSFLPGELLAIVGIPLGSEGGTPASQAVVEDRERD